MDQKLKELIEDGSAVLEKIHDGIHYVKDPESGKIYQWIDGETTEVSEKKAQVVVAPVLVPSDDKIANAQAILKRRGLGSLLKL